MRTINLIDQFTATEIKKILQLITPTQMNDFLKIAKNGKDTFTDRVWKDQLWQRFSQTQSNENVVNYESTLLGKFIIPLCHPETENLEVVQFFTDFINHFPEKKPMNFASL